MAEPLRKLTQAVVDLDEAAVRMAAEEAVKAGVDSREAVRALAEGMRIIGEKWQRCEVFMPEVLVAADAFYAGMEVLLPRLADKTGEGVFSGVMVIGTIYGDVHTVGKDVAKAVFAAELNLRVVDLGVEVPSHRFVEAVKEYDADIVGLGTYMSETFFNTPKVIEALERAGLRDRVIVVCGGPAVDMRTAKKFGADGAWSDAWEAVPEIRRMLDELRRRRAAAQPNP
ncbi:MAG: cobalamin-dependent protein [Candidatus Bathyarchaeia archaeon]|nr:cobalamin-dependent protein [Candidatus Bathyarchaeota archaeon]